MGITDHRMTTCGLGCDQLGEYHRLSHVTCFWCHDRWPCDTALTLQDVAQLLISTCDQGNWNAARIIAPWMDEFKEGCGQEACPGEGCI